MKSCFERGDKHTVYSRLSLNLKAEVLVYFRDETSDLNNKIKK